MHNKILFSWEDQHIYRQRELEQGQKHGPDGYGYRGEGQDLDK